MAAGRSVSEAFHSRTTSYRQDLVRSVAACGVHVAAGHSVSEAFHRRDSGLKPLLQVI
ncbi:protein of unknown function [Shewanella benthica]|uniref:Uncharacterized protein n=1 Tax=Shewanella benthica TaxID=43661 RepID=A0A330M5U8_9GAMM|nr:protein of unknown function [Shewanella benthica]